MGKLLEPTEIDELLKSLDVEWSVVGGDRLCRVFKFDDFKSALDFVNIIGAQAEKMAHHPDIALSWGKVTVTITTHKVHGLTGQDFKLAHAIEEHFEK